MTAGKEEKYSEKEAQARFEAALRIEHAAQAAEGKAEGEEGDEKYQTKRKALKPLGFWADHQDN